MHRNTHTFSQGDLFKAYDVNNLKFKANSLTNEEIRKKYKYSTKSVFIAKIFWNFIKLVIRDLVEKGITFHLPTKDISMFTWSKIEGDKFTKVYRSGKLDKIDFLITNFSLSLPIFKYFYCGQFKTKFIQFGKKDKEKTINKLNTGFKYC